MMLTMLEQRDEEITPKKSQNFNKQNFRKAHVVQGLDEQYLTLETRKHKA